MHEIAIVPEIKSRSRSCFAVLNSNSFRRMLGSFLNWRRKWPCLAPLLSPEWLRGLQNSARDICVNFAEKIIKEIIIFLGLDGLFDL
jgi:hypothetical protein